MKLSKLTLCTVTLFLMTQDLHARKLDLNSIGGGFELFGGGHYYSQFSGTGSTVPPTYIRNKSFLTYNFEAGFNLFINAMSFAVIRAGVTVHGLLPYQEAILNAEGTELGKATINVFSAGPQLGLDIPVIKRGDLRINIGGYYGAFVLNKIMASYNFNEAGIAAGEVDRIEKYTTATDFTNAFYEGHLGIEYMLFSRIATILELGYFQSRITNWVAEKEFTGFSRTVAEGGDVSYPGGSTKSERFGGGFARIVLRSYF